MIAFSSVIWMTRLGSFLFLRIAKDGKDERFDAIKKTWISFLGAWTIQALWVVLTQMPVLLINNQKDLEPISNFDYIALLAWSLGFLVEVAADV